MDADVSSGSIVPGADVFGTRRHLRAPLRFFAFGCSMSWTAGQGVAVRFVDPIVTFGRTFGCAFSKRTVDRRRDPCDKGAEEDSDSEASEPCVVPCSGTSEGNSAARLR